MRNEKITHETKTEITGAEKNKLFPTDIGTVVTDFLVLNFKDILDYNFTAYVEKEFDDIANGELQWNKMISEFYGPFHKTVEITEQTSERASGERILGKDPASGMTLLVRVGRFGPMAQIGTQEETEKPRYASVRRNQRLETITFEEALDLFKLPRTVGEFEGEPVSVSIGRFGPYIKHMNIYTSLKKEDDPYTVTFDRSVELILEKRKVQAERIIKTFEEDKEVQVLNGRWGPYIAIKGKNIKVPKDTDPKSLTLEEIYELEKNAPEPKKWGRGRFGKKTFGADGGQNNKPTGKGIPIKSKPVPVKKAAAKKKPPVTKKPVATKKASAKKK